MGDIIKRTLEIESYDIKKVVFGDSCEIRDGVLCIDRKSVSRSIEDFPLVKSATVDIIGPDQLKTESNTIMDIMPVAVKARGNLGNGVTKIINGVVVFLTGTDEKGRQISEFGKSDGIIYDQVQFNNPGTPDIKDIIIRFDVVIEEGTAMERRGPIQAHQACDCFIQGIRDELKKLAGDSADFTQKFEDVRRPGKPRVLIVQVVGGQGAMHEKFLMPEEPGGIIGGKSLIDFGNVPVIFSPNEIRDGIIHSLT